MQTLQNCERCGKLYKSNGFSRLCPPCWEYDEFDFIHQGISVIPSELRFEVSSALRISVERSLIPVEMK